MKPEIKCVVSSKETKGQLSSCEELVPPGFGPPMHIHLEQTEVFYIIDGEYLFHCNGDEVKLKTGDYIVISPGDTHAFKNIGKSEGKIMFQFTPSLNCEEGFEVLDKERDSIEDMNAFFTKYKMKLVGPPL